ncbi:MAG: c-type cytochrome [Saprospirales bacterium]|nr:c-type cytochrome [Saprospirales bacterium]MBK8489749.1 c-type cytochrome [Saprospirales bacterium]
MDMKKPFLNKACLILPMLAVSATAFAQDAGAGGGAQTFFYDKFFGTFMLALAAVVILAAIGTLYRLLNAMIKVKQIEIYQEKGLEAYLEEAKKPGESLWSRLYKRWTNVVPIEKEQDVLFDHEYDGIRELDNSLPPWWVAMFYITIAFAAVYMSYYHFFGMGAGSKEQYEQEMDQAEKAVAEFRSLQADQINEDNVTALTDEADLSVGQAIFQVNCVACHGANGEGGVGPNMTDQYWINGGGIKNVFKTITYGVPEKGMISWKTQLRSSEIQKVASYILTLQGTNPPNPKEPQGELYQGETDQPAPDSTAVDSGGGVGMN